MKFLDKLKFYLDDDLINFIILPLYKKYVETIKKKIKFNNSLRFMMSNRFSGVYKKNIKHF